MPPQTIRCMARCAPRSNFRFSRAHPAGNCPCALRRTDSKIQFIAASGTGPHKRRSVADLRRGTGHRAREIHAAAGRSSAGFPFSEFKVIGSGANQVIALPIQVSESPLPTSRIQELDENFADSSGFAFAASKEYVEDLLDPLFDAVSKAVRDFKKEITIGVECLAFP